MATINKGIAALRAVVPIAERAVIPALRAVPALAPAVEPLAGAASIAAKQYPLFAALVGGMGVGEAIHRATTPQKDLEKEIQEQARAEGIRSGDTKAMMQAPERVRIIIGPKGAADPGKQITDIPVSKIDEKLETYKAPKVSQKIETQSSPRPRAEEARREGATSGRRWRISRASEDDVDFPKREVSIDPSVFPVLAKLASKIPASTSSVESRKDTPLYSSKKPEVSDPKSYYRQHRTPETSEDILKKSLQHLVKNRSQVHTIGDQILHNKMSLHAALGHVAPWLQDDLLRYLQSKHK